MTKFRDELYPEQMRKIIGESQEAADRQTKTLHMARAHLLSQIGIIDLTNKELLLLSHYVREAIEHSESSEVVPSEEAAEKWFHHITNFHITDFRGNLHKQRVEPGLRDKESGLIDVLREKFNRNDD